jgi:hypothetical protein
VEKYRSIRATEGESICIIESHNVFMAAILLYISTYAGITFCGKRCKFYSLFKLTADFVSVLYTFAFDLIVSFIRGRNRSAR